MTMSVTTSARKGGAYRIGRNTLAAACFFAVATAVALAQIWPSQEIADPALARVLQFMALVKFAGAAVGAWLVDWRMCSSLSPRLAAGYIASIALMLAASALIAMLAHIMTAALLYHAGLLSGLLLAWSDGRRRL